MNRGEEQQQTADWEPLLQYLAAYAALIALLALTVYYSAGLSGPYGLSVSLAVSAVKASIVVLVFMQARRSIFLVRMVIAAALGWLTLLFWLTLGDILTRGL
jgi:caa(3)-type oxidase subunit IV